MNISDIILEHQEIISHLHLDHNIIMAIADKLYWAIRHDKTIFWFGNGGSAADAQHLAAEFIGRFRQNRRALSSIALTTDTSVITAVANDYGYDEIFRRQLEALCQPGDVAVGISTSGSSMNVVNGLKEAKRNGATTIALLGKSNGLMAEVADLKLNISSMNTARIQEAHILCGHIFCEYIEDHEL